MEALRLIHPHTAVVTSRTIPMIASQNKPLTTNPTTTHPQLHATAQSALESRSRKATLMSAAFRSRMETEPAPRQFF